MDANGGGRRGRLDEAGRNIADKSDQQRIRQISSLSEGELLSLIVLEA